MQDYEKLGVFYLGKSEASQVGQSEELLLFDSRELTTHAVILGMTGSGKTGLAATMIEESAIDGIPAILIDPKGDLGNLMLQFPQLDAASFQPWIDAGEAQRKNMTVAELAAKTAQQWRDGLAAWGQDSGRIRRMLDAAEFAIYTPGNTSGRPLQVLRSFTAPEPATIQDASALRERVLVVVSGLLGLLGRDADPVQSRDHILLSNIMESAWRAGRSLDLADIITEVQKPSFTRVGVFDLETFYPARERMGLAMSLNNIFASPGFAAWTQGEPLDIQRLLYTPAGKPRITILHLAHLSDAERMFFVTALLNEVLTWMRRQSGTGSLRALLYMDEIFGYFPPNANPPSKTPMLTLLKQARAYGLGVVLATQNPVDLDYKGLANCGTWFIGRMQTSRDVARVIAGLESTDAGTASGMQRAEMERLLAGLGSRRFLLRNVNENQPILFETRWAMSYLRGPLTLPQVASLKPTETVVPVTAMAATSDATVSTANMSTKPKDVESVASQGATLSPTRLPADIPCRYLRPQRPSGTIVYQPRVMGSVKLHFVDVKSNVDVWQSRVFLAPFTADGTDVLWEESARDCDNSLIFDSEGLNGTSFAELPAAALNAKNYTAWVAPLKSWINQEEVLELLTHESSKMISTLNESEGDFRVRVSNRLREERDVALDKLRAKYAAKFQTITDQVRRADERVERQKTQAGQQKLGTMLSIGAALAGALLGRSVKSVGNVGRVATAARSAGRVAQKQSDIGRAQENLEVMQERQEELQRQFDQEVAELQTQVDATNLQFERRVVRPRKTDITIGALSLCWTPWRRLSDGTLEPA